MGHVGGGEVPTAELTLHSSWRGLAASTVGALLVTLAGVFGVSRGGWRVFPSLVLVCGLCFLFVVLLDYPVASTFSADGVRRRMVLRSQFLAWERIDQITRARASLTGGLRGISHGGLAAVVGRRRYLLVDQPESADEFDRLYDLVGDESDGGGEGDVGDGRDEGDEGGRATLAERMRPAEETPPTWLYRRAKWAPEEAKRR